MRSPPSSKTDFKGLKYRAARTTTVHPANRSPQLLHRSLSGRITRPRSTEPSLSLSIRNQQAVWETVTGRSWDSERVEPNPDPVQVQSLQYIAPQSLTVSTSRSAASSSAGINLEPISTVIAPAGTGAEPVENRELLSSMEFMMPPQYNHFGSYPSSYQSSYMDHYPESGQEDIKPRVSSPPTSYATSYSTSTSPPLIGASPALSPRGGSHERDVPASYSYPSGVRAPYEVTTSGPTGYAYSQTQPAASAGISYAAPFPTSHDPYGSSHYNSGYPQHSSSYMQPTAPSYQPAASYGSGAYSIQPIGRTERVIDNNASRQTQKPICWEHGCNGKQFSTLSNLLRHQREKTGTAAKSECPRCGAVFTRKTARDGHLNHDKCKRKSSSEGN